MQSGRNAPVTRGNEWVIEFARSAASRPDPLMGWSSSSDTGGQVRMRFPDKESAIAFAESRGLEYRVSEPGRRRVRPRTYADNFAYDRNEAWTH